MNYMVVWLTANRRQRQHDGERCLVVEHFLNLSIDLLVDRGQTKEVMEAFRLNL